MKRLIYFIPFILALMFIFINEQTIYTRIAFAVIGLFSLSIAINETIKLKKNKSNDDSKVN